MRYGFVIDNRRCIGCHACSTACKSENEVPLGVSRTWVKYTETGAYPDATRHFQVTRCNHCENPPCVAICPVTAMYQRPDGIVEFDPDVCIGCKACIQACPYDAIHIDPNNGTAAKCHFCSHRTDIGLEPACVVVCPEHAILAGDLDDPNSEVARAVANEAVTVRKPEQGTKPKLFYIEGNSFAQNPLATPTGSKNFMFTDPLEKPAPAPTYHGGRQAEHMIQVGYNAQHRVYWHWQVPAYIVTKDIATGIMMLFPFLFWMDPGNSCTRRLVSGTALAMTIITTLLLVFDLEKPQRFLSIVFRPQWRSWLARGAFVLIAFSALLTVVFGIDLGASYGLVNEGLAQKATLWLSALMLPLTALASVYTAFLFGQAEGRDLWQHPLLPLQLFIRSLMAGSGVLSITLPFVSMIFQDIAFLSVAFMAFVALDLVVTLACEFMMPHTTETAAAAAKHMLNGAWGKHFRWGYVALGRVAPLLLFLATPFVSTNASIAILILCPILALIGLFLAEYAFVMAAQRVPNS